MTITLNLPPQMEQAFLAEAQAKGLSVDNLVRDVVVSARQQPQSEYQELPPDEWMRKFRAWTHSHPTDTPLLSDEAISRQFIYRERGL